MRASLTSHRGLVPVFAVPVVTAAVLLIVMAGRDFSERSAAASLLILGAAVFLVGGVLFTGRAIWKWPDAQSAAYLRWERGVVIAAVLLNLWGLTLLEELLRHAGAAALAPLGLVSYGVGAAIVLVAEATFLSSRAWIYPAVVLYVVLAFLAQAAFGVTLVQTGLVATWVGWVTIAWNLAWLVILPIASPQEVYYPVLHHFAPLLIGLALLLGG